MQLLEAIFVWILVVFGLTKQKNGEVVLTGAINVIVEQVQTAELFQIKMNFVWLLTKET